MSFTEGIHGSLASDQIQQRNTRLGLMLQIQRLGLMLQIKSGMLQIKLGKSNPNACFSNKHAFLAAGAGQSEEDTDVAPVAAVEVTKIEGMAQALFIETGFGVRRPPRGRERERGRER